jgi:hypothetical protein
MANRGYFLFLWSWRDLNPRPNKQQKCFLHAYPVVLGSACGWEQAALSLA